MTKNWIFWLIIHYLMSEYKKIYNFVENFKQSFLYLFSINSVIIVFLSFN